MTTKDALLIKRVPCDPVCLLCGKENENIVHLFANCDFAHACWHELNPNWNLSHVDSNFDWIEEMWRTLSIQILEKIVMVCWAIWENINSMVWN